MCLTTDLPICDPDVLKAPIPLQPVLQMIATAQNPRRPATTTAIAATNSVRRGVSLGYRFTVQHRNRAARGPKREVPVPDERARKRDHRGGVADEQDPFVGRRDEALLDLGDEDGDEAGEPVLHTVQVLAPARGVPHRRPGVVDLGKVSLERGGGGRARV